MLQFIMDHYSDVAILDGPDEQIVGQLFFICRVQAYACLLRRKFHSIQWCLHSN